MAYADGVNAVSKPSYTHQALCDCILENPAISQKELAAHFGYTESWISQILSSDAVQEYLKKREAVLINPALAASMNQRLEAVTRRSMDVLLEKLELPNVSGELALKAMEIGTRALGYGVKTPGSTTNLTFVVAMPPKAVDGESWQAEHRPAPITIDSPAG